MPKARFVVELVDKIKGPAKSAAAALGGLDSKLAGITKSKAFGKLNSMGDSMMNGVKGLATGAGVALAGVTALVAGVGAVTARVDELAERAAKVGFPIKEFQEWEYVAQMSGTANDVFNKGLGTFVKNMGAAKNGMGPLNKTLAKTNPALLEQMKTATSSSEAFELYIASLRDIKDPMLRAKAASDAFGGAGKDMLLMAENSAAAIAALKKEANENGLVTEEQAAAAASYNDAMDRLQKTMASVVVNGLLPLAPAIEGAVTAFRDYIVENKIAERAGKAIGDMITWVTENMSTIQTWAKWIGIGIAAFVALTAVVKTVVAVMSLIATIGVIIGKLKAAWAIIMVGAKAFGVFAAGVAVVPILIGAALIAAVALIWYFRDEIAAFFVAVWSKITEYSAIIWESIKAFGQGILNGLVAAFNFLTMPQQMLLNFLTRIGSSILGAIPGLVQGAMSIGTAIVQGIVSTLSPGAIVARVQSMGSAVISAAKSIFGIASPSKVFAEIGSQNVAGLTNAMEAKAPAAAAAMEAVGDKVIAAAPAANDNAGGSSPLSGSSPIQGSARGGGIVVHAVFNFNGSGTSPEEAQEVADNLLERIASKLEVLEVAV
jgi:hypothetical protein